MIVKAYIDESGTHGSKHLVLGGYVASLGQWAAFNKHWRRLSRREQVPILHTIEAKNAKGPFKNRRRDERRDFLIEAESLANAHLAFRFSLALDVELFREIYEPLKGMRGVRVDSPYGTCVRAYLSYLPDVVETIMRPANPELHVVMEAGHKNAGDAQRIFQEVKGYEESLGKNRLKDLSFDLKKVPGLQIADAIAYASFQQEMSEAPEPISVPADGKLRRPVRKIDGKCPRVGMRITRKALEDFRDAVLAHKAAKLAHAGHVSRQRVSNHEE